MTRNLKEAQEESHRIPLVKAMFLLRSTNYPLEASNLNLKIIKLSHLNTENIYYIQDMIVTRTLIRCLNPFLTH
jgi:hypothetical protein